MPRALLLMLILVTGTVVSVSAQNRSRDFGRAADEWCRDVQGYGPRASHCDVREEILTGVNALDVDTGGNGGIRIRGTATGPIRLRTRLYAHADTDAVARDLVSAIQLSTSGGRVRVTGPEDRRREGWAADFEVEVPDSTPLVLNTRNGGIAIEAYAGKADVQTVNGGISLNRTSGEFRGRTTNGGLRIELDGNRWEGRGLDLVTTNGGITLVVPDNYSAELDAATTNGGVKVDFPVTLQRGTSERQQRITTTLGAGGAPLRMITTNGGLKITRR